MERKNRIPITRLSRYYDEVDFDMELDMAREVIEEDANFTVVLFQIDRVHSNNDLYGESEAREVRFLAPVELKVLLTIEDAENKTYDKKGGKLQYQEYGNLNFKVLTNQLAEKNADISYGDIVGYADSETNMKYFEVSDPGKINVDNASTQFGYKAFFRSVKCVTVDPNQFNGI